MKIDLTGTACSECQDGTMTEMSLHNDWEGTLTCNRCYHTIDQYAKQKKTVMQVIAESYVGTYLTALFR